MSQPEAQSWLPRGIDYDGACRSAPLRVRKQGGYGHLTQRLERWLRRRMLAAAIRRLAEMFPRIEQWQNEMYAATGKRLGEFLREVADSPGMSVEAASKLKKPKTTKCRGRN